MTEWIGILLLILLAGILQYQYAPSGKQWITYVLQAGTCQAPCGARALWLQTNQLATSLFPISTRLTKDQPSSQTEKEMSR